MSPLPIQVEIMPTWSYSHKPMPSTLSAGCFSYTSRLKWSLQELLPQTSAQYTIYRMFLSHIQAEMVPMANISHKTMPRTLSMGCFSYTSRLKWCLWTTLTNQCPSQYLLDASLTHPGWNGFYEGLPPTNPYTVYSVRDASLTHLGWNGAYMELLPQTHAHYSIYWMFLLIHRAEMGPMRNSSHKKTCPIRSLEDVSLTHKGWNHARTDLLPWTNVLYALYGMFIYHPRWNSAYGELLLQTHGQPYMLE